MGISLDGPFHAGLIPFRVAIALFSQRMDGFISLLRSLEYFRTDYYKYGAPLELY
jgi:hypothetical protein